MMRAAVRGRLNEVQQDYLERQLLYPWVIWTGRAFGVCLVVVVFGSLGGFAPLARLLFPVCFATFLAFWPTCLVLGIRFANACGVRRAHARTWFFWWIYARTMILGAAGVRRRAA
jgi:hypothetical protein